MNKQYPACCPGAYRQPAGRARFGAGALIFTPASLTFAPLQPGSVSLPRTITVTNPNSTPVSLNGGGFGGVAEGDYAISFNGCPQTLAANASCSFQITFAPSASGPRPAVLQIATTASVQPQKLSLNNNAGATGTITRVAGIPGLAGASGDGGPAIDAGLSNLGGVVADGNGNIYMTDWSHFTIRKIDTAGKITRFAGGTADPSQAPGTGDGGPALEADLFPDLLTIDNQGNLYVLENFRNDIRKITPEGIISTLVKYPLSYPASRCANGNSAPPQRYDALYLNSLTIDGSNNLYVGDLISGAVCKIRPDGTVSSVTTGNATYVAGLSADDGGNLYFYTRGREPDYAANLYVKVTPSGVVNHPLAAQLGESPGIVDLNGTIYATSNGLTLERFTTDNVLTSIAFSNQNYQTVSSESGDGGPAVSATTLPDFGISTAPNGATLLWGTAIPLLPGTTYGDIGALLREITPDQ